MIVTVRGNGLEMRAPDGFSLRDTFLRGRRQGKSRAGLSRRGCAGRRAEKYNNGKLQNGLVHYVQYAPAAPLAKQGPVKEKVA